MKITNVTGISLPLAVWLVHDEYDYQALPNYFSVTTLMKPLRHIILTPRVDQTETTIDLEEFTARALGKALHDSIEKAWTKNHTVAMKLLGYPQSIINKVLVNPTWEELDALPGAIPVYLEQRAFRKITVDGVEYTIGGKFDLVADGIPQDNKSTSAWSWVFGTKDYDYALQMSMYDWLDAAQPRRKITSPYGQINFIFTDWNKAQARSNPKYPKSRVASRELPLLAELDVEDFIIEKLRAIQQFKDAPENEIPECTDEELWRSDPVFKYYADPTKASQAGARSTRNFTSLSEAEAFRAEKRGVGTVITVPGEPKRCSYCTAAPLCSQREKFAST